MSVTKPIARTTARTTFSKQVSRVKLSRVAAFAILCLFSVIFIFPLLWMLSTSLKAPHEVMSLKLQLLPEVIQWNNYSELFKQYDVFNYMGNTVYITFMSIIGKLVSCTLVAYGFAKYKARGKNLLFMILLATMMVPWAVTMVPLFILFKEIGWYNTFMPLWVPSFFGDAFSIFLLRQFIMGIPRELEEAARIDGAGLPRIIWNVVVPNLKPALTVVAIFSFFYTWNDFLGPLIFLSDPDKATLQLGIQYLRTQFNVQWHYLMAFSVVSLVPCLIMFFFGQRQIVQGITLTGIK